MQTVLFLIFMFFAIAFGAGSLGLFLSLATDEHAKRIVDKAFVHKSQ
jgi:hypothetical protein